MHAVPEDGAPAAVQRVVLSDGQQSDTDDSYLSEGSEATASQALSASISDDDGGDALSTMEAAALLASGDGDDDNPYTPADADRWGAMGNGTAIRFHPGTCACAVLAGGDLAAFHSLLRHHGQQQHLVAPCHGRATAGMWPDSML